MFYTSRNQNDWLATEETGQRITSPSALPTAAHDAVDNHSRAEQDVVSDKDADKESLGRVLLVSAKHCTLGIS